jgi:hypothetical protein
MALKKATVLTVPDNTDAAQNNTQPTKTAENKR